LTLSAVSTTSTTFLSVKAAGGKSVVARARAPATRPKVYARMNKNVMNDRGKIEE
jgi:hypothetical protein